MGKWVNTQQSEEIFTCCLIVTSEEFSTFSFRVTNEELFTCCHIYKHHRDYHSESIHISTDWSGREDHLDRQSCQPIQLRSSNCYRLDTYIQLICRKIPEYARPTSRPVITPSASKKAAPSKRGDCANSVSKTSTSTTCALTLKNFTNRTLTPLRLLWGLTIPTPINQYFSMWRRIREWVVRWRRRSRIFWESIGRITRNWKRVIAID